MSSGFLTKSDIDTATDKKQLLCINEPLCLCPRIASASVQVCAQMPAREHKHDDEAWAGAPLLALDSPMLPPIAVAIDQQQKQPLKPGVVAETISPLASAPSPAPAQQQEQKQQHLREPSLLSSPTSTSRPQGPPQPSSSASPSMPFSRPPSPAPSVLYYSAAAESAAAAAAVSNAAAVHYEAAVPESLEWTFKPDRGIVHPATCSICGPYVDHATTASYDPAQPSYERARTIEHRAKQAIFWDGVKEGRRRERLELEVAAVRYRKERDAAYAEIKRLRVELERLGGGSRAESRTVIDDSVGRGKIQNGRAESQKSAASTDTGLKTIATLASSSSSSALPEIYFSDSSTSTNGILSPTRSNQWAHAQPFVPRSTQPGLAQLWDTLGPNETHGTSNSLLQAAEDTQSAPLVTNQLAYSPWSPRGEETQLLNPWGKKSESTDSNPLSSRGLLSPPSDQQPRLEAITPIGHGRPLPPPLGTAQQEQQRQQQQPKQVHEPPSRIFSPQLTSEVLPSTTSTYSHPVSTTTDANTASNSSASADGGWTTVSRTSTTATATDNAERDQPPPPGISNPPHRVVMPRTEQALQALLDRAHVHGNHAALARVKALCATAHATPRDQKTPLQRYILANWRNPTWGGQTTATSSTPAPTATTRTTAPSFLASYTSPTWAALAAANNRNANDTTSTNNNSRTTQQQQPMNNPRLDDPVEAWAVYLTRHTSSWPRGVRRMPDGSPHLRDLTASRIVSRLRPALATPGHHADGAGATAAMLRAKFTSVCIEVFARKHAYAETLVRTGLSVRSVTSGGDLYQYFHPFVPPSGLTPESLTREHVVGHFAVCGVPVNVAEGEMHGWAKECERQTAQSAPGPAVAAVSTSSAATPTF